jgi:hypothetical protein
MNGAKAVSGVKYLIAWQQTGPTCHDFVPGCRLIIIWWLMVIFCRRRITVRITVG